MASSSDERRAEEANRRTYDAMEKAMQARGFRTARALAQALNESGYKISERAVAAWRNREAAIPGWALVAFSDISGLTLDALTEAATADSVAETVARHERMLGEMQAKLIEVCEQLDLEWHPSFRAGEERQRATGA